MSKESNKEERKKLIRDGHNEEITEDNIGDDEECCKCSCKEMWKSYKQCCKICFCNIVVCCRWFGNSILNSLGFCFFPIKERLCKCCNDIDVDLNPYKNPNYNPYDYL